MLQRCHVCGRVDETCKPCEHCGWWFCEKHIDPEQHGCTGRAKQARLHISRLKHVEEGEQSRIWRLREGLPSLFLEFGILLLAFFVIFGARTSPYVKTLAEEKLQHKTLELEPFSIRWFAIYVMPRTSAKLENLSLRIQAYGTGYEKFNIMVYALDSEEKVGFLKWWGEIEKYGIYREPNFTKALYEARGVWTTSAMVPIRKSGLFELCYVVLNLNPDRSLKVDVSSSLLWLEPVSVNLSYSLDSPGLFFGLPLAALGVGLLIRRALGERFPKHSPRWIRVFDTLAFAAIMFIPLVLYLSTEKELSNAIVFMHNSYNPIDALTPESLAIYAIVLQSILLHEYGHFAAARAMGLKAEITWSKEPNVLAATRITAEKPVAISEYAKIRRMGPVSNLLLAAVSIPFILSGWWFTFIFLLGWNLIVFNWNRKEFSIRIGTRRLTKDTGLFTEIAKHYVKRVGDKTGVKLDYSLESLRSLADVSSRLIRVEDPSKISKEFLFLHVLQTGSYIGETIIRSLNGKWVEDKNPVGWAVGLDGEKIDVFQIALESVVTPDRFNELYEKLASSKNPTDTSPSFDQNPKP
ncbi:MAG: hypothetical protein QXU11_12150 [Thermoproteota archaeon]